MTTNASTSLVAAPRDCRRLKPPYGDGMIHHRVAPAPLISGMSRRSLPAASFQQLSLVCDHFLGKGAGYEGPASRLLFDLAHEIKVCERVPLTRVSPAACLTRRCVPTRPPRP